MKEYDYIVVGSGIAGLTMARILAIHRARVLLLEKSPSLGGSCKRFRLNGIPFDVGFHFTGGFADDGHGVLDDMLALLGIRDRIKPIYYPRHASHEIHFPSIGARYTAPSGLDQLHQKLRSDFPTHRDGLDRYFARFHHVIDQTPTLRVSGFDQFPPPLDEDCISLRQVLDECVPDPMLQSILGGFCMCYGTRPAEVSFSTHCRISFGLHESLARVEHGGQAFVDALVDALAPLNVDIRTGVTIEQCTDIENRRAGRFILTDGSEVSATACIFAIHPRNILATLLPEHLSKAFQNRVLDLEPSIGFFAMFGTLDSGDESEVGILTSIFPDLDLDAMLSCRGPHPVDGPLVVLRSPSDDGTPPIETLSALEVTFPQWTASWASSRITKRPTEYYHYKQQRMDSILQRIGQSLPQCRKRLHVLDCASNLTFRDYLNSPDGAAYGIKQKIGQFNVAGRLPITNIYATGQCALLPGIIGAMTSAFLVARSILGKDTFTKFLAGQPCR